MLHLIPSDRHQICLIQQNIGSHKHRICKQSRIYIIGVLCTFVLKLRHSRQLAEHGIAVEHPCELRMRGNVALHEYRALFRVDARSEVDRKRLIGMAAQVGGHLTYGDGVLMGIATGLIVYLIYGNFYLGCIIFLAMIANQMIAGFCGAVIPLIFKALGQDPALASSIFLTAATDVLGFFIFLSLARVFLPLLM